MGEKMEEKFDVFRDLTVMSDAELNQYITDLSSTSGKYNRWENSMLPGVVSMLQTAIAEKNSRNATKLTKVAITVAASSVVVAIASVIVAAIGVLK